MNIPLIQNRKKFIYKIKQKNEDFKVTEIIPTPQQKNSGSYAYCRLIKFGVSTTDAINILSKKFRISQGQVSVAGMKDEEAIAIQFLSFYKYNPSKIDIHIKDGEWLRLEKPIYSGTEPIKKGYLLGNVFEIAIRNMPKWYVNKIEYQIRKYYYVKDYVINYFDQQRFGRPNSLFITHKIGEMIIKNKYEKAAELLYKDLRYRINKGGGLSPNDNNFLSYFKNGKAKDALNILNKRDVAFFMASYSSMVWNKEVSDILKNIGRHRKLFDNNKHPCSKFVVPDDIKNLSMPIVHEFHDYYYDSTNDCIKDRITNRSIVNEVKFFFSLPQKDDLNHNKFKLSLTFYLPSGCYATCAVQQLLRNLIQRHKHGEK